MQESEQIGIDDFGEVCRCCLQRNDLMPLFPSELDCNGGNYFDKASQSPNPLDSLAIKIQELTGLEVCHCILHEPVAFLCIHI